MRPARFHRGVSALFRDRLVRAGIWLDEEAAQLSLAGMPLALGQPAEEIGRIRTETWRDRDRARQQWEQSHPEANPFPPPFPQRIIDMIDLVVGGAEPDPDAIPELLTKIRGACQQQLDLEPPFKKE